MTDLRGHWSKIVKKMLYNSEIVRIKMYDCFAGSLCTIVHLEWPSPYPSQKIISNKPERGTVEIPAA